MKKINLIILLFLMLASGNLVATDISKESIVGKFSNWYDKWSRPIKLAIAIMIAISAIVWAYGHIFSKDDLKVWVKAEIANVIYTVLILFFLFSLLESISFILNSLPAYTPIKNTEIGKEWIKFVQFTCQNQEKDNYRPCHIKIAQTYLEILAQSSKEQITNIMRIYNIIAFFMSLSISFKSIVAPGSVLSISPLIGLVPISELLQFCYDILLKNYIVLKAQQIALDLMHVAFFPYLLSFGLFLRVFHFTRKLGGLLISIAVCFYIVWPLLYVFWASIYYSFTGPWELDIKKISTFVTTIYFEAPEFAIQQPDKNSPDYSPMCANGIVEEGEECNEYDASTLKDLNPKILNCPPKDAEGKVINGREKDIYCNYNNCKCISKPIESSINLRKDIIKEAGGDAIIAEQARRYVDICYSKAEEENWWDKTMLIPKAILAPFKVINLTGAASSLIGMGLLGENGIIHNISKVFIFSIIAPFISLMTTLACLKVLSPLFGGDAYLAGLSRLI
ncbi:MAG: hypothetical protein QXV83_01790 [Candidatus Anstonellaceae archaeon]